MFLTTTISMRGGNNINNNNYIRSSGSKVREILLSPISVCKSPPPSSSDIIDMTGCTPAHSVPCSPSPSPKRKKMMMQSIELAASAENRKQKQQSGRKEAVSRYRSDPSSPSRKKESMPRPHSSPSLSSSHNGASSLLGVNVFGHCKSQRKKKSSSCSVGGDVLAASDSCDCCWGEDGAESLSPCSSRDRLLTNHDKTAQQQRQQLQLQESYSSYDCNYKHSQERAYEEFGVERKLVDKVRRPTHLLANKKSRNNYYYGDRGAKKTKRKHWINNNRGPQRAKSTPSLPLRSKTLFSSLKKSGSASLLPPSGRLSSVTAKKKSSKDAIIRNEGESAQLSLLPPTSSFHVNIKRATSGHNYSSSGVTSAGYYSAPIEMELCPDRSLCQMGMEVTEEDYCIEGEYNVLTRQQLDEQPQPQDLSGRRGSGSSGGGSSKKLSDSILSMKELAKGLGNLEVSFPRSKSCSPKVLTTKVLSALRRGGSGDNATTSGSSSSKKKKIPHQIAFSVTPSTSEDTAEEAPLSLDEMKILYKWQQARIRKDMSYFSPTPCDNNTDDERIETDITKKMSEDTSCDRTVSVDNRRTSLRRQVSF